MKIQLLAAAIAATALPAAAQDWSGAHIGINIGPLDQDSAKNERLLFDTDLDRDFDDAAPGAIFTGYCQGTPRGAACTADDDSLQAALRLGYDWQSGPWVFGVVGDLAYVDADDSVTGFTATDSYTFVRDANFVWGVRGRVGRTFGPNLAYATAGPAIGDVDHVFLTTNSENSFDFHDEDNLRGYQWGLGIERSFGAWSAGIEYLRTVLDDERTFVVGVRPGSAPPSNPFIAPPNTAGINMTRSNRDFELESLSATIAYHFRPFGPRR